MYHNIYQIIKKRNDKEWITEETFCFNPFLEIRGAYAEDVDDRETELKTFGEWLEKEGLGRLEHNFFVLNSDVIRGRHFAKRYTGFHRVASELSEISEDDYLNRFHDVRNLVSDLMKSVVDDADDLICIDMGSLMPMDEFLRTAKPNVPYYIGGICKYHL